MTNNIFKFQRKINNILPCDDVLYNIFLELTSLYKVLFLKRGFTTLIPIRVLLGKNPFWNWFHFFKFITFFNHFSKMSKKCLKKMTKMHLKLRITNLYFWDKTWKIIEKFMNQTTHLINTFDYFVDVSLFVIWIDHIFTSLE